MSAEYLLAVLVGCLLGFVIGVAYATNEIPTTRLSSCLVKTLWLWVESLSHKNTGGKLVYIVAANHPDTEYQILFDVIDSEGNVVEDADVKVVVSSSNEDVLTITENADVPNTGTVHFGTPGVATFNVQVFDVDEADEGTTIDVLIGSFAADFTVVPGDPEGIRGGEIVFSGLTEV